MSDHAPITVAFFAQTDVGLMRNGNEDNFLVLDLSSGKSWTALEEEPAEESLTYPEGYYGTLLAVSDGMGGALAGEVASRLAVETVRDRMLQLQAHAVYRHLPFSELLRVALEQANELIHEEGLRNPLHKGLGATFTAVASRGGQAYFAQVGDSRAYLIRQGAMARVTKDQSLVQQLIDAGQITEEEAETHSYRNVILQALGAHPTVSVEVNTLSLHRGDILVLCSDGLSGKLRDEEIAQIVLESATYREACRVLIGLANHRGGDDNITVVIAGVAGEDLPVPDGGKIFPLPIKRREETPYDLDWDSSAPDGPPAPEGAPPPPMNASRFGPRTSRPQPPAYQRSAERRDPITSVFSIQGLPGEGRSPGDPGLQPPSKVNAGASSAPRRDSRAGGVGASSPRAKSRSGQARQSPLVVGGLVVIGLSVILFFLIGAGSLVQRSALPSLRLETRERLTRTETETRKEGQVLRLRNRIDELEQRLNHHQSERPVVRKALLDWQERIKALRGQLNEVTILPSNQSQPLLDLFEAIEKELTRIEGEINNLQGLRPASLSDRDPVRI
jgi:serine/threonine protein phosphatase PrpC